METILPALDEKPTDRRVSQRRRLSRPPSLEVENKLAGRGGLPRTGEERDFEGYMDEIRHGWLKTLCALGFTLIPVFYVLDYFMIPGGNLGNFAIYRGVVTCAVLLQYLLLRKTQPSEFAPLHGYFFSVTTGLMISQMTHELGGFDSTYYAGLNLVMIAVIVLIPWGFFHAVMNALLAIGTYLFVNLVFSSPFHWNILGNNLYFLVSSAVIAVAINRVHFQLIRKEFFANGQLTAARKEQDTIMNSVNEGLFIIHKVGDHYVIGGHQSDSVKRILGAAPLSGQNFAEVLSAYFSPKKIGELVEYLQMISSERVVEDSMIDELNPLQREAATVLLGIDSTSTFLEFRFKRIAQAHQNTDFLVSIKDVTREVEMIRQIRDHETKTEQESQMMLSILHVGPALLQDFMEGVETELGIIQAVLQEEPFHKDYPKAIETIFRAVHSVKGNAALLELKFLAEKADRFEEKLLLLRDHRFLTWENFLPIAYDLARLQEVHAEMQGLVERIRLFQSKGGESKSALSALPDAINQLALRIASELGKKVRVIATEVNFDGLPSKYAYILRDILVQLTRNAVTHGIEDPETRKKMGKDQCGTIELSLRRVEGAFCVDFRDDGRSFDFDAIRAKAVKMGRGNDSAVREWTPASLIKLTFEPGFSTAGASHLHAGRGMGMDVIKQRVHKIGGQLKVKYVAGQFTRFESIFPIATPGSSGRQP